MLSAMTCYADFFSKQLVNIIEAPAVQAFIAKKVLKTHQNTDFNDFERTNL